MYGNVITLSKEAAVRQREALRLLSEENEALRKQAGGKSRLSKEAAERAAAALAQSGHIREAERTKAASALMENPESAVELLEAMAQERKAPASLGAAETVKKASSAGSSVKESDAIWDSHFGS